MSPARCGSWSPPPNGTRHGLLCRRSSTPVSAMSCCRCHLPLIILQQPGCLTGAMLDGMVMQKMLLYPPSSSWPLFPAAYKLPPANVHSNLTMQNCTITTLCRTFSSYLAFFQSSAPSSLGAGANASSHAFTITSFTSSTANLTVRQDVRVMIQWMMTICPMTFFHHFFMSSRCTSAIQRFNAIQYLM